MEMGDPDCAQTERRCDQIEIPQGLKRMATAFVSQQYNAYFCYILIYISRFPYPLGSRSVRTLGPQLPQLDRRVEERVFCLDLSWSTSVPAASQDDISSRPPELF